MGLILIMITGLSLLWLIPGLAMAKAAKIPSWRAIVAWPTLLALVVIVATPYAWHTNREMHAFTPFFTTLNLALYIGLAAAISSAFKRIRDNPQLRLWQRSCYFAAALAPAMALFAGDILGTIFKVQVTY